MIDKLKSFVSKHRQEFDTREPSKDLWEKIDARMEVKKKSWISSKWLSRFKYMALSTSVLLLVFYLVSTKFNNSVTKSDTEHAKSIQTKSEVVVADVQSVIESNSGVEKNVTISTQNSIDNGISKPSERVSLTHEPKKATVLIDSLAHKNDSSIAKIKVTDVQVNESVNLKSETTTNSLPGSEEKASPKKEPAFTGKNKKTEAIPEEIEKIDTYKGILYEGSSFCSLVKAYKFPGQISIDGTMKTMGCSKLESISNMKAVCVKGKTGKKITLSLKDGFKNIVLEKRDGRKLYPEAISHYYKGLGVISGYTGKYFDMFFKDKVELILFFKDAEAGDKILIDGTIEAVVESK